MAGLLFVVVGVLVLIHLKILVCMCVCMNVCMCVWLSIRVVKTTNLWLLFGILNLYYLVYFISLKKIRYLLLVVLIRDDKYDIDKK